MVGHSCYANCLTKEGLETNNLILSIYHFIESIDMKKVNKELVGRLKDASVCLVKSIGVV